MDITRSELRSVVFAKFSEGEDLLESIADVARRSGIDSGFFLVIGTLRGAVLGYYRDGKYLPIEKSGTLEIASCMGNVSVKEDGELVVHGHIVVSDESGSAYGGHIMQGCRVDVTAELVLIKVASGTLKRSLNPAKNLYLLDLKGKSS